MIIKLLFSILFIQATYAIPSKYTGLLPFIPAPIDQGDTNTCLYVASTGAMELLLNKSHWSPLPWRRQSFNLSESFLIWADDDEDQVITSFIEAPFLRFNHGEAILNKDWPFNAYKENGEVNMTVWDLHPDFDRLPRLSVPKVETIHLFTRGRKWSTGVLTEDDLAEVKNALVKYNSPVIINYNDDDFWHVVLIVGFDDELKGECYQMEAKDCQGKGALYVRDSNGHKVDMRAYEWFIEKANSAAVAKLRAQ